jgi:hypothetical protein
MTPEQESSSEKWKQNKVNRYPRSQNFQDGEYLPSPDDVQEAKNEMALDFLRRDLSDFFSQEEIRFIVDATSNYRHSHGLFKNRNEANKTVRIGLDKIDGILNDIYNTSKKDSLGEPSAKEKELFKPQILKYLSEEEIALLNQALNEYGDGNSQDTTDSILKSKFQI